MLIGLIRPVEVQTREVTGEGIAAIHEQLTAPPGWELTQAHMEPQKGSTEFRSVGIFARRDALTEIEADDTAALRAKVPDGYELLSIIRR
ncbi:hypothetical protein [Microbacterium sp. cx-59]|uniref:hypothetical protein n=1 Tax=Microbacterium sp. cx-59 TaxID=2891207 RepID=UPI001E3502D7|nr:hypothetical protein [Microbacterium sp. cx-59]MCC4906992.1 hypothetical protein [Microbacterium sp. cx-59]